MKLGPTLIAVLLLAPLTALPAADTPSLQPPQHLAAPKTEHAVTNRAFTGIPSMAVAPKGRLWATWYAGVTPAEDANNYVVLSTSGDDGKTWTEVLTVDPDGSGPVRSFDPELWVSPDGRLFFFWAQMEKGRRDAELGVWCIETNEPDAANPTWSKPRRIGDGVMMCKPLTLSSGEWVLPISRWKEHDHSAQMIVSTDAGKTWSLRGTCNVPVADRQFDEHMFVERRDGSMWLLVRTKYGIGESVSTDRGKTWPELKPSAILHTPSRSFIRRLASGNLLLVKHGPLDTRTSRSHLTAYLSKDDGKTWSGGLMLDERLGVSYPDGQQTPDGLIRIIYDFNRTADRNILIATFREEDALAGKDVSGTVKLRQLVSKATGGQEKAVSKQPVNANATGEPLRTKKTGTLASEGIKAQPFVPGAKLFSDRDYLAAEVPDAKMQLSAPEVSDLSRESEHVHALYGTNDANPLKAAYAKNCLLTRRYLEQGVRYVSLYCASRASNVDGLLNWDAHRTLKADYDRHCPIFDQPTAALLTDLKQRGMLDDVLVIWCTEFGRMPTHQVGTTGRDHNPDAYTTWMMGAGVKGGVSYGATDDFGRRSVTDVATCYDFYATVLHLLGLDHEKLTYYHNGVNRRFTDVHGHVIKPILA